VRAPQEEAVVVDTAWLVVFAGAHLLLVATATLLTALRRAKGARLLACMALAGVIAVSLVQAATSDGSYLLLKMLRDIRSVNSSSLVAVCLGVSTAMAWFFVPFSTREPDFSARRMSSLLVLTLAPAFVAVVVGAVAYRDYRSSQRKTLHKVAARPLDPRFCVDAVVSFADGNEPEAAGAYPICVAVDENDRVFVSLQLKGEDDYSGRIFELVTEQGPNDKVRLKTVADSPCLFRTFGLAVRGGEIFVSRSGFLAHARKGRIEYENSGAITRLRDLDRDGMMDYYEDVVTGLPGAQGPVSQHSNNGIAFGPDGSLYFTQGVHSDRDVLNHPWEGKILRASPNYQKVTVFASGLRNPFGLVFGPDGQLFATDNDVTLGNPGDELNLIKEGADYGHPYVVGDDDGGGQFTKPLLLWKNGSFAGLTYGGSSSLPAEYRGCLYLADFIGHRIWRVTLIPQGGSYSAKATPFVEVPFPVGVAVTRTGVFYISSYEGAVFRVRIDINAQ
jgi:sugar lactone lactonase YvrE